MIQLEKVYRQSCVSLIGTIARTEIYDKPSAGEANQPGSLKRSEHNDDFLLRIDAPFFLADIALQLTNARKPFCDQRIPLQRKRAM